MANKALTDAETIKPRVHQIDGKHGKFCSNRGCSNPAAIRTTLENWAHEDLCVDCFRREYPGLAKLARL
jgi:hypothetical protein